MSLSRSKQQELLLCQNNNIPQNIATPYPVDGLAKEIPFQHNYVNKTQTTDQLKNKRQSAPMKLQFVDKENQPFLYNQPNICQTSTQKPLKQYSYSVTSRRPNDRYSEGGQSIQAVNQKQPKPQEDDSLLDDKFSKPVSKQGSALGKIKEEVNQEGEDEQVKYPKFSSQIPNAYTLKQKTVKFALIVLLLIGCIYNFSIIFSTNDEKQQTLTNEEYQGETDPIIPIKTEDQTLNNIDTDNVQDYSQNKGLEQLSIERQVADNIVISFYNEILQKLQLVQQYQHAQLIEDLRDKYSEAVLQQVLPDIEEKIKKSTEITIFFDQDKNSTYYISNNSTKAVNQK